MLYQGCIKAVLRQVGGEREAEVWLRRALALSLARIKPESNEGAQAEGEGEAEAEAEGVTCPLTGEAAGHVLATDRVYALYEGAACNLAFCLRRRQRYAEVHIYQKSCIMVLLWV